MIFSIYYVQGDLKVFVLFHTSMEVARSEMAVVPFLLSLEPRQGFGLISFLIRCAMELCFPAILGQGECSSQMLGTPFSYMRCLPGPHGDHPPGHFSLPAPCFLCSFGLLMSKGMGTRGRMPGPDNSLGTTVSGGPGAHFPRAKSQGDQHISPKVAPF